LLEDYLENRSSLHELQKRHGANFSKAGAGHSEILKILTQVEQNEFKRRQAAIVLKISRKAFGSGRRIPIAKTWQL
jgi:hypothetical protein